MYRIHVRDHFDAAHYLRGYQGRCEALHGHRWEVVVALESDRLNEIDLAYDFTDLKRLLRENVLSRLDHRCLNDVPPFDRINATTENLARVIFGWLQEALDTPSVHLAYVEVYESPDSWVRYRPEEGA
ncbi:MAG: 6-carboxytetrahydropterin synthase QueD [Chloroflexia bacterium]